MKKAILSVLGVTMVLASGCGGKASQGSVATAGPENSASAVAVGAASGATARASGQALAFQAPVSPVDKIADKILDFINPESTAWCRNIVQCPTYERKSSFSGCEGSDAQTLSLIYPSCSNGESSAIWSGGERLEFSGNAVCGTTTFPIMGNGEVVKRTFIGARPGQIVATRFDNGGAVGIDTQTPSGYSKLVSGGTVITGTGKGHVIAILGMHLTHKFFDYTVSTADGLPLTVVNPGANRTIESGTILIQHNKLHYTGTVVFNNVAYNATSCLPQSGSVVTTFTGSKTGLETLTFTGNGSVVAVNGNATTKYTLSHCF